MILKSEDLPVVSTKRPRGFGWCVMKRIEIFVYVLCCELSLYAGVFSILRKWRWEMDFVELPNIIYITYIEV